MSKSDTMQGVHWPNGSGASSMVPSGLNAARLSIADHERQHRVRTFPDAFRDFLHRYEIEDEKRCVWA